MVRLMKSATNSDRPQAESERYLPVLIDKVEKICEDAGLRHDDIVMRMTGCPNGCARCVAAAGCARF